MSTWLMIITAGVLTYAIRLSSIFLFGRINIPEGLQRALRFVPPAVFTAIFLPELFWSAGDIDLGLGNERLLAGLLAIIVAWRTKNVIITIVVGMIALWILQVLIN
jgi:branched-subunit amino acid transport protein